VVAFYTIRHLANWHYGSPYNGHDTLVTSTSSYYHTDTIVANTSTRRLKSFPVGESIATLPAKGVYFTTNYNRHLVDTLANGLFSYEPGIIGGVLFYNTSTNCWGAYGFTSSNPTVRSANYVENFGVRHVAISIPTSYSPSDTLVDVVYANMPGCRWGSKARIAALEVNTPKAASPFFVIYPNPASERLTVAAIDGTDAISARLVDFSGKLVVQKSIEHGKLEIMTRDVSAGFYFLEVATKEQREVVKVIILH
jgi:hypothetical protein